MLIRNAEMWNGPLCDVRIIGDRIAAIGDLKPDSGENVIDAAGGALLPGLHDHHIHLAAAAVRAHSVFCGPPGVRNVDELRNALCQQAQGWLRGIGYHESVAGMLDRSTLDGILDDRPVRIQHRSGRMWFLNSLAIEMLLARAPAPDGLDVQAGHLFDADEWLRRALKSSPPDLEQLSRQLAEFGITGVTDMSPSNDAATVRWLADQRHDGKLLQHCVIAGTAGLAGAEMPDGLATGPLKLHLHEAALPDFDASAVLISAAHKNRRPLAVHCTTEIELVFALALLEHVGVLVGDRIEHAGIANDHLVSRCRELGLHIVSQPHFIMERGDQYLADVPKSEQAYLYRLASFAQAGLVLAAGSDAPYGSADPWFAMRSAISRNTASGQIIGLKEALSPETALALYLGDPNNLGVLRRIKSGAIADLCLLDRAWKDARVDLDAKHVRLTIIRGVIAYDHTERKADN